VSTIKLGRLMTGSKRITLGILIGEKSIAIEIGPKNADGNGLMSMHGNISGGMTMSGGGTDISGIKTFPMLGATGIGKSIVLVSGVCCGLVVSVRSIGDCTI